MAWNAYKSTPTSRPTHHLNDEASSFANPWPHNWLEASTSLLRLPFVRAEPFNRPDIKPTETVKPDWSVYESPQDGLRFTWLGHAGFLVQFPTVDSTSNPVRVVFDPMFAERASPSNWFGPTRWLPPPCTVNDLPAIDFVCISHNHYDHLDLEALLSLYVESEPVRPIHFLVPLGVKALLVSTGIDKQNVSELDWWNSITFPLPTPCVSPTAAAQSSAIGSSPSTPSSSGIIFTCTPTQHNSGRNLFDQGTTLWGSWAVKQTWDVEDTDKQCDTTRGTEKGKLASVWFAGDTGYQTSDGPCPVFKEIGTKYGPFDLALIPIWRGASLSFIGRLGYRLSDDTSLIALHASPEDALRISTDVQARHSVAMHFATFAGSEHEALEPLVRLVEGRERVGRGDWWVEDGFGAVDIGAGGVVPLGDIASAPVLVCESVETEKENAVVYTES